jgi:acyl dehydratase
MLAGTESACTHYVSSLTDQRAFARLSGDWNPLHVDSDAARRTPWGQPLVHGVHLVLRALELAVQTCDRPASLGQVRARFREPVRLGEEIAVRLSATGDARRAEICVGNTVRADVSIVLATRTAQMTTPIARADLLREVASDDLALADMPAGEGTMALAMVPEALEEMFPSIAEGLPHTQIAMLLAVSRLIGMRCPGRRSLLAQVDLLYEPETGNEPSVRYRVTRTDPRFARVDMAVEGPGARGTVAAFVRVGPETQPPYATVRRLVDPAMFAQQRALVVGGSRGLGEATVKLLAAGGADVRLTFKTGEADARRIASDIAADGGRVDVLHLDVLAPPEPLRRLMAEGWTPTHLYYFATPPIFVGEPAGFSMRVFQLFSAYYVDAFQQLLCWFRTESRAELEVFYPSTSAIDQPAIRLTEYACAKAAGEVLCRYLESCLKDVRIRVVRLPRVRTDQTATVQAVPAQEAVEVMRPVLVPTT